MKTLTLVIEYNKMVRIVKLMLLLAELVICGSCEKFLDKPSQKSLTIPSTLRDCQAIMEDMNSSTCGLEEVLADNYYVTNSRWQNLLSSNVETLKGQALSYAWQDQPYGLTWWREQYRWVYNLNNVLDILPSIPITNENQVEWKRIKGQALFKRSLIFWFLAQDYCKPYSATAANDPGLPLRLTVDFDERSVRSSLQHTYDQILEDLQTAASLLPEATVNPTRPNKAAAFGALSRVYLSMRDYANAGRYADSSLSSNNSLMDYNSLNPTDILPIPLFNQEQLYYESRAMGIVVNEGSGIVDSNLYRSYGINDLRKIIYFKALGGDNYGFQGSYSWQQSHECPGIATDEMYLNRAECYARAGNKDSALSYLNQLLKTRWKNTVTYDPITATDLQDALNKILIERRKELLWRCLRWTDLRRLNLEGANISLKRIIGATTYTLPVDDPRWVVLIPQDAINFSGMQQNPR
jgi:tetratricopeptide (TPR) repeat protein